MRPETVPEPCVALNDGRFTHGLLTLALSDALSG